VALIGWLLFFRRIVGNAGGYIRVVRALIWMAGTVFFGIGCIITQTRTAWIASFIALMIVVLSLLIYRRYSSKQLIIGFLVAMVLSLALIYPMSDLISNRLERESDVIHQLLDGDVEHVPYTSIGIRVHTWLEAWKWIKQRPITGWGYEVRGKVFTESTTLPGWVVEQFGHFHNSYIEILLSYGLIGIFFLVALYSVIVRRAWQAWRSGIMPTDVFLFGLAFFIFWILVNLTESYLIGRTGVYFTGLIGGCMYTFSLSEKLKLKSHAIQ
jgi:O-antigen ligase